MTTTMWVLLIAAPTLRIICKKQRPEEVTP